MSQYQWKVTYQDKEGRIDTVSIEWPERPTREQVAIRIREHLLGEDYLLVDTPLGHEEPTVLLLYSYGFEIKNIEEIEALSTNQ